MALNINSIASKALETINNTENAEFTIVTNTWATNQRIPITTIKKEIHKIKLQPADISQLSQFSSNLINSYQYFMFFINVPIFTIGSLVKTAHHTFKIGGRIYRITGTQQFSDANWSKGVCYLSDIETVE